MTDLDSDFQSVEYEGSKFWKLCFDTPGPIMGTHGPLFKYSVFTEQSLKVRRIATVKRIDATLADARGWTRGAVRFQRVAEGADTDILLCGPNTVDRLCAPLQTHGEVSCCQGRKVVLNYLRWVNAVAHWKGSGTTYRQMLINHEMGHRIGKNHAKCQAPGQRAPVMQQQTYGLQGCRENSWPLNDELLR